MIIMCENSNLWWPYGHIANSESHLWYEVKAKFLYMSDAYTDRQQEVGDNVLWILAEILFIF